MAGIDDGDGEQLADAKLATELLAAGRCSGIQERKADGWLYMKQTIASDFTSTKGKRCCSYI